MILDYGPDQPDLPGNLVLSFSGWRIRDAQGLIRTDMPEHSEKPRGENSAFSRTRGRNLPWNITIVQALLKSHQTPARSIPVIDKIIGRHTIAAIKEFQARVVKMSSPDGRVDPQDNTVELSYGPVWISAQTTANHINNTVATVEAGFKKAAAGMAVLFPTSAFSRQHQIVGNRDARRSCPHRHPQARPTR